MSFLDKAKKLAEQAAEKAGPLIDKATPHAQNALDKAGQKIDKRTGGKYHDKIEAVEAKVGELAEKRMAGRAGDPAAAEGFPPAGGTDAFPGPSGAAGSVPGTAGGTDSFPGAAGGKEAFPGPSGAADSFPGTAGAADAFPGTAGAADFFPEPAPAQPDLDSGQPDDPAYSASPVSPGLPVEPVDRRAGEPSFSAPTADVTFPAPAPEPKFPAEPDTAAGQPDDPAHSPAPTGAEFPGLSEGTLGAPEGTDGDDRPHSGGPAGSSGTPTP